MACNAKESFDLTKKRDDSERRDKHNGKKALCGEGKAGDFKSYLWADDDSDRAFAVPAAGAVLAVFCSGAVY